MQTNLVSLRAVGLIMVLCLTINTSAPGQEKNSSWSDLTVSESVPMTATGVDVRGAVDQVLLEFDRPTRLTLVAMVADERVDVGAAGARRLDAEGLRWSLTTETYPKESQEFDVVNARDGVIVYASVGQVDRYVFVFSKGERTAILEAFAGDEANDEIASVTDLSITLSELLFGSDHERRALLDKIQSGVTTATSPPDDSIDTDPLFGTPDQPSGSDAWGSIASICCSGGGACGMYTGQSCPPGLLAASCPCPSED